MTRDTREKAPRTVLLVDDEDIFRMATRHDLTEHGFEVLDTGSPEEGLELFFRRQPDAVVLDLNMPGLSGLEVLERIVENDTHAPVVVVSAEDGLEDALTALRLGASDYICKGSGPLDELAPALEAAIRESRAALRKDARIKNLRDKVHAIAATKRDYERQAQAEAEEKERLAAELEDREHAVKDMTVTLRTVIRTLDEDKDSIVEDLEERIRSSILPHLGKMVVEESRETREATRKVLEEQLLNLVDGHEQKPDDKLLALTATELSVAQYIKAGSSTSEVADLMHSSLETIQTHRKNIRKKFGLVGKNVSLQVYLRSVKGL